MATKSREEYLELAGGRSSKFWAIMILGRSYTIRFGKIGAPGQNKSKQFESAERAESAARSSIAKKIEAGYEKARSPLKCVVQPISTPKGAREIAFCNGPDLVLLRRHYPSGHLAEVSYFDETGRASRQSWFIDRDEDWKAMLRPWVLLDLDRLSRKVTQIKKLPNQYPVSYRRYDATGREL